MLVVRQSIGYLLAISALLGCWQGGAWLSLLIPLPASLLGLLLLFGALVLLKDIPKALHSVSQFIVLHMLVLFVPATMGVIYYADQLQTHLWLFVSAVVVSTLLSLIITAGIWQWHQRHSINTDQC